MLRLNIKHLLGIFGLLILLSGCGGGSDSATSSTNPQTTNPTDSTSAALPESVKGQIVTMEFGSAANGAPYSNGDQVLFAFSSSGSLMLTDQYTVVAASAQKVGSEYVWTDSANSLKYALSLMNDTIHEVNLYSLSDTFLGQFAPVETNTTTPAETNTTTPSETDNTPVSSNAQQLWKRTEESNKVAVTTTNYGFWASSVDVWDSEEMKFLTDNTYPLAGDKLQTTLQSSSATQRVYRVTCDSSCVYANLDATYTFSLMSESEIASYSTSDKAQHSANAPQELIGLAGTYSVADTTLAEYPMGYGIAQGHMSLELTIAANGDIHYVVKDKDDETVLFDKTVSWDGEKDELTTNGNHILLDKYTTTSSRVFINKVSGWFEFHLYVPLSYPNVGNNTVDIQWNVPYSS